MVEKIKNYYRNSPKRIALTWINAHIFFLIVGYLGLQYVNHFSSLWGVLFMVWFFPSIFFGYFGYVVITVVPLAYYSLFIYMCFKAKDTSAKKFYFSSAVFSLWFLLSLCVGLYAVFSTIF